MQKITTRELNNRVDTYEYKVRRDARQRKNKYTDKIVSIVQSSKGVNAKPYLSTHCSVNIPHAIAKLMQLHHGSLVEWRLSDTDIHSFVLTVIPEEEGDSS
jgi:hypothetical protein